jgi:hypothetical protein
MLIHSMGYFLDDEMGILEEWHHSGALLNKLRFVRDSYSIVYND